MKNRLKNLDLNGSTPYFFAFIIIIIMAFRRYSNDDVDPNAMLLLTIASFCFTFSDIFKSFKWEFGSRTFTWMGVVAVLYALVVPSGYVPRIPILDGQYASLIDFYALFAVAAIILSFGIKKLFKFND
jgi:hypothetical protein